jgi:hypothetical protein
VIGGVPLHQLASKRGLHLPETCVFSASAGELLCLKACRSRRERLPRKIKAIYEYEPGPDNEEHLRETFALLFRKVGEDQRERRGDKHDRG